MKLITVKYLFSSSGNGSWLVKGLSSSQVIKHKTVSFTTTISFLGSLQGDDSHATNFARFHFTFLWVRTTLSKAQVYVVLHCVFYYTEEYHIFTSWSWLLVLKTIFIFKYKSIVKLRNIVKVQIRLFTRHRKTTRYYMSQK